MSDMSLPTVPQLRALLDSVGAGLLERETAVRLALLTALAGEHVLLIGPPGTAKSELARRLQQAFADAPWFERLLTRFSTPEELFGPLSLKALEEDRYERLTAGFLPTAGVAFLDEVFKANSAILNALLTVLNERQFDNGSGRTAVPLISVVGASNELPVDDALLAFFDRFLVRVPVTPVSDEVFTSLLRLQTDCPVVAQPLDAAARRAIDDTAAGLPLGDDAVAACCALRRALAADGRTLSDRRWRQWMGLMRCAAASEGRPGVDALDLWTAPYVAASTPEQVPALQAWVDAEVAGAVAQDAPWLTHAVEAFEMQLQVEQMAPADDGSADDAGKLALARAIGIGDSNDSGDTTGGAGMLRIVAAALEERLRRRWSPLHVQARLAQVDEVAAQVRDACAAVGTQAQALADRLRGRVWLPPSLAARWLQAHAHSGAVLDALRQRLEATRAGFAAMPVDETLPPTRPEPVPMPETTA